MATVALVGATGSLGHVVLPTLVASDAIKNVVCISRKARKSDHPKAEYIQVDYAKPETLEKAMKGCDVLINTMGTEGNYEESKHALVDAAAKVGVKFYIPSQFGVDVHVESDAVNHSCWNGKKEDDIAARKKGLIVIPIMVGLFMEHPQGGFMPPHGFMREEEIWYMPGTGDTPVTFTSKRDISLSIIEIIKMAQKDSSKLPSYFRIAGTNNTPKEIVDIFNKAAKGKTHLKLKLLNDQESDDLMKNLKWDFPSDQPNNYDLEYMNEVASRVFRMSGGTGNLDFSDWNHNELLNLGQSKWNWKTMEEYAEEVGGMPGDWHN